MSSRGIAVALATWFYTGYSPVAPGTVASLGAWVIAWALVHRAGLPSWTFAVVALAMVPLAVWCAEQASAEFGLDDPSRVVIDEVVGLWVAVGAAAGGSWPQWITALVLFRVFDIAKPLGLRRLEELPGGRGIVADDLGAGACAMIGTLLVRWAGF